MADPYELDIQNRNPDHTLTVTPNGDQFVCELKDADGVLVNHAKGAPRSAAILKLRRAMGIENHIMAVLTPDQRQSVVDEPDGFQCMDTDTGAPHTFCNAKWHRAVATLPDAVP